MKTKNSNLQNYENELHAHTNSIAMNGLIIPLIIGILISIPLKLALAVQVIDDDKKSIKAKRQNSAKIVTNQF